MYNKTNQRPPLQIRTVKTNVRQRWQAVHRWVHPEYPWSHFTKLPASLGDQTQDSTTKASPTSLSPTSTGPTKEKTHHYNTRKPSRWASSPSCPNQSQAHLKKKRSRCWLWLCSSVWEDVNIWKQNRPKTKQLKSSPWAASGFSPKGRCFLSSTLNSTSPNALQWHSPTRRMRRSYNPSM